MIEELNFVKEKLQPLKDLEEDIYGFGKFGAVKDVSIYSLDLNNKDFPDHNYKIIAHRLKSQDKTITVKYYRRIYQFYWGKTISDEILNFIESSRRDIDDRNFLSKKLILPELKCEKKNVWFRNNEDGTIHLYIFGAEII